MEIGKTMLPPRHKTAKDYVYDALTQAFTEGRITPGSRLGEKELSEWLKVSRTPVREALAALEGDGLVEIVAHHGAVVRTITAEDIREGYTVRAALESLAVELAVPRVPDDVLAELSQLVDEMHAPEAVDDVQGFIERNRELHLRLYSFCGSQRLITMIESAWNREDYFRRFYYALSEGPEHEDHMHHDLIRACIRRDASAAHDLVKNSLLEAAEVLAELFKLNDAIQDTRPQSS